MPRPMMIRRSAALIALCLLMPLAEFTCAQEITFIRAQVDSGKDLYKESCQLCHGSSMVNGQFGTPLRGSYFQDKWNGKSVGELLTFVYEKMPPDKPMSLTPEQYTSAVAYILSRNDMATAETPMSTDKATLVKVMLHW